MSRLQRQRGTQSNPCFAGFRVGRLRLSLFCAKQRKNTSLLLKSASWDGKRVPWGETREEWGSGWQQTRIYGIRMKELVPETVKAQRGQDTPRFLRRDSSLCLFVSIVSIF